MANARKDVLDFITNHYEECDEDFQSAMLRYRELFFSRKAATEKSKAIITIRRKAKAPAKAAPEAKRLKAAPTAAGNQTAFRREEPGRKAKTPSASVSYAAAASGSGASAPPTGKPQVERAASASLEAEQAARKESSNGSRAKAGTSTSLPDPMEQETAPGDRRNKTPLFVSGVKNTRTFLKWLKEQTGGDGSARVQGDKLVLVPNTADCFRATVRVLRSIEASKGVSFHTYSLPEDRCTRLLIKGLGKTMPEQDVREELEILGITVQSVLQLRSQRRDPDPAKDRFPTPHFIVTVARGPLVSKVRAITSLCGLRVTVDTYRAPKGPIQCKNCQRFGHTKRNCGYPPRCVACGGPHVSDGKCTVAQEEKRCANCNSNHTANYRGCSKWKESKATSSQRASVALPRNQGSKPKPKKQAQLSPEQQSLGPEWSHVSKGGRTVKPQTKEVQQSEPIAPAAKVTKVAKPRNPSTKRTPPRPSRATRPWQPSLVLPRTFLSLLSLA